MNKFQIANIVTLVIGVISLLATIKILRSKKL